MTKFKTKFTLAQITEDATEEAREALRCGKPIEAVKAIRKDLNCSLADANALRKKIEAKYGKRIL